MTMLGRAPLVWALALTTTLVACGPESIPRPAPLPASSATRVEDPWRKIGTSKEWLYATADFSGNRFAECRHVLGVVLREEACNTALCAGPRDLAEGRTVVARRDTGEKVPMELGEVAARVPALLEQLQAGLLARATEARDRRTVEVATIVRELLSGRPVEHHGEFYDLEVEPPRVRTSDGTCPPFYFGGLSEAARDAAAQIADVYLTWPDTVAATAEVVADLRRRAAAVGRELRFGFRCHVIVRDTESEARAAAERLVSRLDPALGEQIRQRSLDTGSAGVARQVELREAAGEDGFVEDHLWTGIGRARSGAGAAIVGDPDQVVDTIRRYREVGVDCFILSGYPHLGECERVARTVLPALRDAS